MSSACRKTTFEVGHCIYRAMKTTRPTKVATSTGRFSRRNVSRCSPRHDFSCHDHADMRPFGSHRVMCSTLSERTSSTKLTERIRGALGGIFNDFICTSDPSDLSIAMRGVALSYQPCRRAPIGLYPRVCSPKLRLSFFFTALGSTTRCREQSHRCSCRAAEHCTRRGTEAFSDRWGPFAR